LNCGAIHRSTTARGRGQQGGRGRRGSVTTVTDQHATEISTTTPLLYTSAPHTPSLSFKHSFVYLSILHSYLQSHLPTVLRYRSLSLLHPVSPSLSLSLVHHVVRSTLLSPDSSESPYPIGHYYSIPYPDLPHSSHLLPSFLLLFLLHSLSLRSSLDLLPCPVSFRADVGLWWH
jgi:hypothetical protein